MKLVSFGPKRAEKPGVVVGTEIIDLCAADVSLPDTVRGILAADRLDRVAELAKRAATLDISTKVALGSVRLGPPVTNPSKIVCLGRNYQDHADEQDRPVPERPLLFSKSANSLAGDGDEMPYPRCVEELDYEIELAVVVGRVAKHVDASDAYDYVAGYGVFMDITARDLQRSERQWFRGKNVDGSGPFGPWLVTTDEIAEPHALDISMDLNGKRVQSSNTHHMIFKVGVVVSHISQTMTLEPGDIVATGTPAGVGVFRSPPRFLHRGDRLTGRIDNLGTLACTIA